MATNDASVRPLLLCNLLALDRRRLSPSRTPYLSALFEDPGVSELRTFPNTDLISTWLLGAWPTEHGFWHVQWNETPKRTAVTRLYDALPDGLNRTLGCFAFLVDDSRDLAAVPSRRRRHFLLRRYKHNYRGRRVEDEFRIGERETFLNVAERCGRRPAFHVSRYLGEARRHMEEACTGEHPFECLEVRFLDNALHWEHDVPERVNELYRDADRFVRDLHGRCRERGYAFALMACHGQEPVRERIDLASRLRGLGVGRDEFVHFLELTTARFWFRTDRAREAVTRRLDETEHVTTRTWQTMESFGFRFPDRRFGDLFAFADPGYVYFPHDFYHPLANLFMGIVNPLHRRRIFDPVLRGVHGYLPDNPSERGFFLLDDPEKRPLRPRGELIDVAPTVLRYLDCPVPAPMTGTPLFESPRGDS